MSLRKGKLVDVVRDAKGKLLRIDGHKGAIPEHLAKLRIPPAWTDVRVNTDPGAKLWVIGTDVAGRCQRIYSTMHVETAATRKYRKIRTLIERHEDIRDQILYDMEESDWSEESVVAFLIYETGIRPGSTADTKAAAKAYGATTLEARHIKVMASGNVWLRFTGKKGVVNSLKVSHPILVKELRIRKRLAESPRSKVFGTSDRLLRDYLAALTNSEYTPKDLRSLRANLLAMELVRGRRVPSAATKRKRIVREVVKAVADTIGNTPTVCRKSYIDPAVFSRFAV